MSRADPAASSQPLPDVLLSWRLPYLLKTGIAPDAYARVEAEIRTWTREHRGTTLAQFVSDGFDPRLYNEIDFQRGRVRPRTILNFSVGADLFQKERTNLNIQFDVQNVTNELFLYNFESVFSGTHVGFPRLFSARIGLRFK